MEEMTQAEQHTSTSAESKKAWETPILTVLNVQEAESGNNLSEGTGTGS